MSKVASKVEEIMRSPAVSIQFSESVAEAVRLMLQHDIGALIVDKGGQPAGIITDKDVLRRVVLEGRNPRDVRVDQIMSSPLITVSPKESIGRALALMRDRNIRRLPVMEGKRLLGIITEKDLIKAIL
ncbi:MAG: CBS domain-containing protein [Candidatus Bathyarchaeia archaeon]